MDKTVGFLKEKLTDRETLYGIILFCFGMYMFQYTSKLDYGYRLLYRFVMLIVVMFIYRKFINKGDMKTSIKNFKLKGKLHKILILIGVVEFITMFIVVFINGGYETQTPTQSLQEVEYAVELTSVTTVVIMFILSFFIMVPMMYSMIQSMIQLRLLTIWIYNNHRKWFVISLIGVDLLFTAITSFVM